MCSTLAEDGSLSVEVLDLEVFHRTGSFSTQTYHLSTSIKSAQPCFSKALIASEYSSNHVQIKGFQGFRFACRVGAKLERGASENANSMYAMY